MSNFALSPSTSVTLIDTPYSVGPSPPVSVHRVVAPTSAFTSSGQLTCGRTPICCSSASSALVATSSADKVPDPQAARPANRTGTAASRGKRWVTAAPGDGGARPYRRRLRPAHRFPRDLGGRSVDQARHGRRQVAGHRPRADEAARLVRGQARSAEHLERLHVGQRVEPSPAEGRAAGGGGPAPQP